MAETSPTPKNGDLARVEVLIRSALKAIRLVRDDLKIEKNKRRRANLAILLALFVFLTVVAWNMKITYDQCTRSNEAREEVKTAFDVLVVASLGENPDAERVRRAEEFTNDLDEALPNHECERLPI